MSMASFTAIYDAFSNQVKQAMIDWLGPILYEYYSSSEDVGLCRISPEEWLARPGSVGQPVVGRFHVCDSDGINDLVRN